MNHSEKLKEKLIAYCMGALSSEDRLEVEENLLNSKEILIQFISVKRAIESNEMFQVEPSLGLKARLKLEVNRSFINEKPSLISWMKVILLRPSFGLAIAILVVAGASSIFFNKSSSKIEELKSGVSVDGANQSPVTLNFL